MAFLLTVAAVAVAMGCKSNNQAQLDPVPPPVESDPGPAYVGPYETGSTEPQVITIDAPPVEAQPTVIAPAGGQTYTVQKGDTLYRIAKMHYGSGNRWPEIADANGISDPTKLFVGKVLTLP